MKKKIMAILLVFALTMGNLAGVQIAYAEESGDFFGITWSFDGADTLILDGNGPMKTSLEIDYEDAPWTVYAPSIKHIIINSGFTTISYFIYQDCTEVVDVTIPDTVEDLNYNSFPRECIKLERVIISEGNKNYISVDGVVYSKDMTQLIRVPMAYSGEFIVPDTVESIYTMAFRRCANISHIALPKNLKEIELLSFFDCTGLTKINIPDKVAHIGDQAFYGCAALVDITIGDGIRDIGLDAFKNTGYYNDATNWYTDESGKCLYVDDCLVVASPNGTEFRAKAGTRMIGNYALDYSNLTSVVLPDSVLVIGACSFRYSESLNDVVLSDHLVYVGDSAFEGCPLGEISLPDSLVSIGSESFDSCNLTSVHIPKNVTEIGKAAFGQNLISEISVAEENTSFEVSDGVLFSKDMTKLVFVPVTRSGEYIIPDMVTHIGPMAFYYCDQLTDVIIPEGVTSIGEKAFVNCNRIVDMELPNSVTMVEEGAFSHCRALANVKLPDELTAIEKYMFNGCYSLKKIQIPNTVTYIGDGAFSGCQSLENIEIPYGITEIREAVFNSCKALRELVIPETVTKLGAWAFYDCLELEQIMIPKGVRYIGEHAFSRCAKIKTIDIPDGVNYIGYAIFSECSALESVVLPDSIIRVDSPFANCSKLKTILYTGIDSQFAAINNIEDVGLNNKQVVYNYDRGTYVKARGGYTYNSGSGFTVPLYYALKDCVALMGIYDEETLICLGVADVKKDDKEVTIKLNGPYTGYTFKWMFWEDLNSMNEMGNPVEINTTIQGPAKQ